jgi:N,N'-diacetylchitobiose transport system substrate-binding protein
MKGMRWLAAGALTGVLAVAGCGGSDDEKGSSARAGGEVSGTITTWIMDPGSPKLQEVFNGYAKDFEAEHPGTDVKIEFVPWAQAHDKFTTAIAGGKVPDVAEMGTTWTPEFADQGAFEAVPASGSGEYVSSLVDAATLDDEVWGKPWYAGARALIYRKDVFKKAGIAAPPKTWDELKAAAAAIKAKGGGDLPDRVQRPDRALLPADDLAGRR